MHAYYESMITKIESEYVTKMTVLDKEMNTLKKQLEEGIFLRVVESKNKTSTPNHHKYVIDLTLLSENEEENA
jgi:hypothetical protein